MPTTDGCRTGHRIFTKRSFLPEYVSETGRASSSEAGDTDRNLLLTGIVGIIAVLGIVAIVVRRRRTAEDMEE